MQISLNFASSRVIVQISTASKIYKSCASALTRLNISGLSGTKTSNGNGPTVSGGEKFNFIACLNDSPDWIAALGDLAERHLQGWPTRVAADPEALATQRQRALALGAQD